MAIYEAREALSEAERRADEDPHSATQRLAHALGYMISVGALVEQEQYVRADNSLQELITLIERTKCRIDAATAHARLVTYYEDGTTDFEIEQEKRSRSHARRAAEAAKAEAHRVLSLACDLFPDAYRRDDG